MNIDELNNYLETLHHERMATLQLLNNIEKEITLTRTKREEGCLHLEKEREYDECDQRNYYRCKACGLL